LSILPVERKERKRKEQSEKLAIRVNPEEITGEKLTNEELERNTRKRMEEMRSFMEKRKPLDFWKFILDPNSFSQSVENIFHYSFLIKDGQTSLEIRDDIPIAATSQPPRAEDTISNKQCVLKFDFSIWEQLRREYKLDAAILPRNLYRIHRESSQPVMETHSNSQEASNDSRQTTTTISSSSTQRTNHSRKKVRSLSQNQSSSLVSSNTNSKFHSQNHNPLENREENGNTRRLKRPRKSIPLEEEHSDPSDSTKDL